MMNLFQRLNEVRKAVAYVKKEKLVKGQNYMAVTHDDVTAAVREHLIAQGVIVSPTLVSSKVVDTTMVTANGTPIIRYEALFDIRFINCDEPQDQLTLRIESHALDQGDKAPGKAISYATKYALLKLFSIETGEEDEDRVPAKVNKPGSITAPIAATTGAWDDVPKERHEILHRIASGVIDYFTNELIKSLGYFEMLPETAKIVLISMAFNLGVSSLLKFTHTLENIEAGRYITASREMLNSKWKNDVGNRAYELSEMMASC